MKHSEKAGSSQKEEERLLEVNEQQMLCWIEQNKSERKSSVSEIKKIEVEVVFDLGVGWNRIERMWLKLQV